MSSQVARRIWGEALCFSAERTSTPSPQQFPGQPPGSSPQTPCRIWETQASRNHSVPPAQGTRTRNSVFFPPRKQKMLPREKQTPEVLTEAGTKDDNNLNILRETLLSEKLDLAEGDIELKERSTPPAFLPDPQESES